MRADGVERGRFKPHHTYIQQEDENGSTDSRSPVRAGNQQDEYHLNQGIRHGCPMRVKDFFLLVHCQDCMEIVAEESRDPYEERAKHSIEYVGLD